MFAARIQSFSLSGNTVIPQHFTMTWALRSLGSSVSIFEHGNMYQHFGEMVFEAQLLCDLVRILLRTLTDQLVASVCFITEVSIVTHHCPQDRKRPRYECHQGGTMPLMMLPSASKDFEAWSCLNCRAERERLMYLFAAHLLLTFFLCALVNTSAQRGVSPACVTLC